MSYGHFFLFLKFEIFFRESLKLKKNCRDPFGQSRSTSMQNLESVAQIIAISLFFPSLRIFFMESLIFIFCRDPCEQSGSTFMQNLESVAQKMAES